MGLAWGSRVLGAASKVWKKIRYDALEESYIPVLQDAADYLRGRAAIESAKAIAAAIHGSKGHPSYFVDTPTPPAAGLEPYADSHNGSPVLSKDNDGICGYVLTGGGYIPVDTTLPHRLLKLAGTCEKFARSDWKRFWSGYYCDHLNSIPDSELLPFIPGTKNPGNRNEWEERDYWKDVDFRQSLHNTN